MIAKTSRRLAFALGVASAVLLGGCSSGKMKTAVVKGKVTFNGKAVPNGTVNFTPEGGGGPSAMGDIQPDGSYSLTTYRKGDGAILGQHKVTIVAMEDMTNKLPEARNPLPPAIVPEKYTSLATTDLKVEVKDQVNEVHLDLKGSLRKGN